MKFTFLILIVLSNLLFADKIKLSVYFNNFFPCSIVNEVPSDATTFFIPASLQTSMKALFRAASLFFFIYGYTKTPKQIPVIIKIAITENFDVIIQHLSTKLIWLHFLSSGYTSDIASQTPDNSVLQSMQFHFS